MRRGQRMSFAALSLPNFNHSGKEEFSYPDQIRVYTKCFKKNTEELLQHLQDISSPFNGETKFRRIST